MSLRRIAQALRRQDWSMIVVEILIVVVGIFIGLQVDDWNERREARQLYLAALNAFMVESTSNRELLDARIESIEQRMPVLQTAIRHLVRCEPAPGIDAILDQVVDMSYVSISPRQSFVAYEAMATNTRFQELISENFRLRLNAYYSDFPVRPRTHRICSLANGRSDVRLADWYTPDAHARANARRRRRRQGFRSSPLRLCS